MAVPTLWLHSRLCCRDLVSNGPNGKHSLEENFWHLAFAISTVAPLQVARLGWLPKKATFAWWLATQRTGKNMPLSMKCQITGLLNSPKTKMINGIMLVVFPCPFVQVSIRRCHLEMTDWIVVPGAWVPNRPNADGFWGLGFGKVKALLHKPRHQHLLVGDPLHSVG